MAERVVERTIAAAESTVFSVLRSDQPALVRLNLLLDGYLAYTDQGLRPCLLVVLGQTAPPAVRTRVAEQLRSWQILLESTLCELREVKPKKAARLAEETLCGLYGGTLLSGLLDDPAMTQRSIKRLRRTFDANA
jgi:hypothetical protein